MAIMGMFCLMIASSGIVDIGEYLCVSVDPAGILPTSVDVVNAVAGLLVLVAT